MYIKQVASWIKFMNFSICSMDSMHRGLSMQTERKRIRERESQRVNESESDSERERTREKERD